MLKDFIILLKELLALLYISVQNQVLNKYYLVLKQAYLRGVNLVK
jgi:hypothetical protein